MMSIGTEFIEEIQKLSRPDKLEVTQYGKYSSRTVEAVYNDANQQYEVQKVNASTTSLSSTKSLIQFVKEEFKRRDNKTGNNSTLRIGINGGKFTADDNFGEGICEYKRVLSQQWEMLDEINGRIMNHEEFLMALLKLSPSINDFREAYKSFLKVRVVGNSEMVSNPVFVNNQAESGYMVKYKLQGGQSADDVIPDHFSVTVPYVKASDKKYDIDVDVQIMNDNCNNLKIKINIPLLENKEEQAIIDEIENIKGELGDYKDMSILSDI